MPGFSFALTACRFLFRSRRLGCLLVLLALAGCSAPDVGVPSAPTVLAPAPAGITLVAPTAAPTSTLGSASTLVPTTAPTVQVQPATQTPVIPIVDPVNLIRDQESSRLEARTGRLVILNWLDATHALIYWSLSVGSKPDAMNTTYLIDLVAGRLDRLAMNIGEPQSVVPNGRFAVLLWSGSMTVDIVDKHDH